MFGGNMVGGRWLRNTIRVAWQRGSHESRGGGGGGGGGRGIGGIPHPYTRALLTSTPLHHPLSLTDRCFRGPNLVIALFSFLFCPDNVCRIVRLRTRTCWCGPSAVASLPTSKSTAWAVAGSTHRTPRTPRSDWLVSKGRARPPSSAAKIQKDHGGQVC